MLDTKQNGNNKIMLLLVIVGILVIAGVYFTSQKQVTQKQGATLNTVTTNPTPTTQTVSSSIQTPTDLNQASNDLDATNIDSIDNDLNQNTADSQTFAPRIRLKNGTSSNWAGYAVLTNLNNPQNNAVSDVKGSWVVPKVDCTNTTSNTYSATWIGIDGYSDNSVEQTGTEQDCLNGQPYYAAWYEMYPKPSFRVNMPIKAGDSIRAEVNYTNKKFVLTLTNTTAGKTFTTSQKSNAQRQSAEWIMEAPWSGGVLPLANFGTMNFTNAQATLNGHSGTINDVAWQNDPITMTTSSGTVKAVTSLLSSDGSNFSITWNSN